jgi:hypothetical protein
MCRGTKAFVHLIEFKGKEVFLAVYFRALRY